MTEQDNNVVLKRRKVRGIIVQTGLTIAKESYEQLKGQLVNTKGDEDAYIELYLLRYHDKTFYPPTLAEGYYKQLSAAGVGAQLFATPTNHYFTEYGSEYYDIDQYFSSFGSIMKDRSAIERLEQGGSFEVNLLHYGPLHTVVVTKLDEIIRRSKKKITLFIVYDLTINRNSYEELESLAWSAGYQLKDKVPTRQLMILKSEKVPKNQPTIQQINAIFAALSVSDNKKEVAKVGSAEKRITYPILYPYEKAVIIAERATHLARNCPPKVKVPPGTTDPLLIAEMELEQKVMPMVLPRMGELWDVNELEDFDSGAYRY